MSLNETVHNPTLGDKTRLEASDLRHMSASRIPVGISIIIPCFNYASYLPLAIESCLRQTHKEIEILVVDDGSSDCSVEVAESYRAPVRCIRQRNQGVGAARNFGIREAKHDFVVFLDADDILLPRAIELLLAAYLQSTIEPGIVAGCARIIDVNGRTLGVKTHPEGFYGSRLLGLREVVLMTPFVPTVLARKGFLEELNGFEVDDKVYRGSEDKLMWIKIAAASRPIILLGDAVVCYRVHGASMSHNRLRQLASSQAVLRYAQSLLENRLPKNVWDEAWSVTFFQMAITCKETGSFRECLLWLWQSFRKKPALFHRSIVRRYGRFFRIRISLIMLVKKILNLGKNSK